MNVSAASPPPLLEVSGLGVYFHTREGLLKAVDGVSFHIDRGEVLGLVGESGCGKSVTAFSILRLIPQPPGQYAGGKVCLEGEDLLKAAEKRIRSVRGNVISMIFQEPVSSLNPIMTVGRQISEAILQHQRTSKREARRLATEMLGRVGIASPEARFNAYPHQLSGGM